VNGIYIQVFWRIQLAMRALNNPDRPFFPVRAAAIGENRLPKLLGNGELVVHGIINDPMHRPPEKATLSFYFSNRLGSIFRQPGENAICG